MNDVTKLKAALEVAMEYIADQVDVIDGPEGGPRPNKAMQAIAEINEILSSRPT